MPEIDPRLVAWESRIREHLISRAQFEKTAGLDTQLRLNEPAYAEDLEFVKKFWEVTSLPEKFEDLYRLTNGFNLHYSNGHVHPLIYSAEYIPVLMQRCDEIMAAHPLLIGRFLPFIDCFEHPMGYYRDQNNEVSDVLWSLDIDTLGYSLANPDIPISNCFGPSSIDLWSYFEWKKS
jgi:hypothetical protein